MKAGDESAQETLLEEPVSDVPEAASQGINVGVMIVFAVILVAVVLSNIWLRRRAAREE